MPDGPGPRTIRTGAAQRSRGRYLPLVFGALALAMVCGSFTVPWYSYSVKNGPDWRGTTDLWTTTQSLDGEYSYNSEQGKETFVGWSDVTSDSEAVRIFPYLWSLVAAGVVLAAGAVVGLALSLWKGKRGIAAAIAVVLAAWCLFTPIWFMVYAQTGNTIHSPGGFSADSFWGRTDLVDFQPGAPDNEYHSVSTWGPLAGWFMSLFAGIFAALTLASVLLVRPRPALRQLRLPVAVSVIIAICLVGSAVALYPAPVGREPPGGDGFGWRVEALVNGDWMISITTGSYTISGLVLQVVDPANGSALVKEPLSAGTAGNPDFLVNDTNGNKRLDAGDTIILKGTINGLPSSNIQAGFRVQLLRNDNVIGTLKELPPH